MTAADRFRAASGWLRALGAGLAMVALFGAAPGHAAPPAGSYAVFTITPFDRDEVRVELVRGPFPARVRWETYLVGSCGRFGVAEGRKAFVAASAGATVLVVSVLSEPGGQLLGRGRQAFRYTRELQVELIDLAPAPPASTSTP